VDGRYGLSRIRGLNILRKVGIYQPDMKRKYAKSPLETSSELVASSWFYSGLVVSGAASTMGGLLERSCERYLCRSGQKCRDKRSTLCTR
jgi:hypothetical protein